MSKATLSVIYPKGFLDKPLIFGRPDSKAFCEKWRDETLIDPLNVIEEIIPTTLEELILNFNKIINKYKSNLDTYLSLNSISKILTNEESIVKYALNKLDGTKGRCVISKKVTYKMRPYEYVSYNPNLKETKKQLLVLFNKFKKTNDTNDINEANEANIIMYEGHNLFIHLFSIVIDWLHVPEPEGKKKDCTDIFSMITLLELLLNKKYKNILEFHINNTPLPISTPEQAHEEDVTNDGDVTDSNDDEWDKDNFEPVKTIHTQSNEILEHILHTNTKNDTKNDTKNNNVLSLKKNDVKTEEIPDDWDTM
jgi:hypothetical protein